jgi:DNA polymerase-3 subunit delta
MKIVTRDIKGFLAKPDRDACAILLYGPDAGLARERSQDVVKYLLGPSPDAMSILDVSEARLLADPAMLADELSAASFLADKRVILVRDAGDKFTKIMESVEELLSKDNYVIVLGDDLGSRSSLRAWFEKAPNAAAVPCYHDEARDIGELVRETFSKSGVMASGDVVQYLASQLGNDRYVTRQELEKLLLYLGDDKTLGMETVKQLTDHNRETEMDEAITALADRNLAALDKALIGLMNEGLPPVAYLRGLSRYFQRLYAIKLQAKNSSIEQVIENLRPKVFYKQKDALTRHARKWDVEAIAKALALITSAELACKTSDLPVFAASERELFKATRV